MRREIMVVILTPEYRETITLKDKIHGDIQFTLKPISGLDYLRLSAEFPDFVSDLQVMKDPAKLLTKKEAPEFIKKVLLLSIESTSLSKPVEEIVESLSFSALFKLFGEAMRLFTPSEEEVNFLSES